ncbi:MAG: BACON domain-containing protein [Bacteroidales bacterium]|jgi:hypothetical protein|nr:BACON domain-containing protein [Bacteroidales bacterium]
MNQSFTSKSVQHAILAFLCLLLQGCSYPGLSEEDIQLRISEFTITKPFEPAEVTVTLISQNHSDYTTKTGWLIDGVKRTVSGNKISNLPVGNHSVQAYAELSTGSILYSDVQTFRVLSASNYLPQVSIPVTNSTTANSATLSASVTDDKGYAVTERGFCWSATTQQPTITDNKTVAGKGTGSFSATITGLATGTSYNVRTYAINEAGTSYSDAIRVTVSIPTLSVSKSSLSFAGNGSYDTFTVTSNALWTVSCNQTWCTAAVSGNQVTVSVTDNLSGAARTATVRVAVSEQLYQDISITQAKPTLIVSETAIELQKNSSSKYVSVTSNIASWSVSSNQSWCTVVKGTSSIRISATINPGTSVREAIVTIALPNDTKTIRVQQNAL